MHVTIKSLEVKVLDRPLSDNYLSLQIDKLSINQVLSQKPKRVIHKPEQKLYVKTVKVTADEVSLKFGRNCRLSQSNFNLRISYETLAYSPLLSRVDPSLVE